LTFSNFKNVKLSAILFSHTPSD